MNKSGYIVRNKDVKNIYTSYDECPVDVDYKEYVKILQGFAKFIMDKVLDGEEVVLPAKSGHIYIAGRQIKPKIVNGEITGLAPDWVRTKQLWESNPEAKEKKQLVYHFNEHTNGVRYRIQWDKMRTGVRNRILYTFIPTRTNKRKVWKSIMDGKEFLIKQNKYNEIHNC